MKRTWTYGCLPALLATLALLYALALKAPALFDDTFQFGYVSRLSGPFAWLTTDCFQYFRPIKNLIYRAFLPFYPASPAVWHLVCIVVHLVNVILVRASIRSLDRRLPATLCAALWALAPTLVSSVAWLSCLNIQLMLTGFLSSVLLYERSHSNHRRLCTSLSLVCYFLALMNYETAITILVLLPVSDYLRHPERLRQRTTWIGYALYLLTSLCYFACRFHCGNPLPLANRPDSLFGPISHWGLCLSSPYLLMHHVLLWLWPFGGQAILTSFVFHNPGILVQVALSWIASGALLVFVFCIRRRWPTVTLGLTWTILTLLPMCNLLPVYSGPFADYYLGLPSIGLVIAGGALVNNALHFRRQASRAMRFSLSAVLVAMFLWRTAAALLLPNWIQAWNSKTALLKHAIQAQPGSYMTRIELAGVCRSGGRFLEAETLARQAQSIAPWCPKSYYAFGDALIGQGRYSEALTQYRVCEKRFPGTPAPLVFIGQLLERYMHDKQQAFRYYLRAISLPQESPYSEFAVLRAAAICAREGNPSQAIALLQHALPSFPNDPRFHHSLAANLYIAKRPREAWKHALRAAELGDPLDEETSQEIRRAAKDKPDTP